MAPYLDTELTEEHAAMIRERLRERGMTDDQIDAIRAEVGQRMLKWNVVMWLWEVLTQRDMLEAMNPADFGDWQDQFEDLYWRSMEIAALDFAD